METIEPREHISDDERDYPPMPALGKGSIECLCGAVYSRDAWVDMRHCTGCGGSCAKCLTERCEGCGKHFCIACFDATLPNEAGEMRDYCETCGTNRKRDLDGDRDEIGREN